MRMLMRLGRVLPSRQRRVDVDPDVPPRSRGARPRELAGRAAVSGAPRRQPASCACRRATSSSIPRTVMMRGALDGAQCRAARAARRPRAHPDAVRRPLGRRCKFARGSGVPARRDLPHVLRGIPASLRAAWCRARRRAPCARALRAASATRRRRGRAIAAAADVLALRRDRADRRDPTGLESRVRGGDGAAFRAAPRHRAERPLMLYVGRVAHEKNIGFLLRVLAPCAHACRTCCS